MTCTVFDQVPENPSLTSVENGLQHFRKQHCDSLIAMGGGSVIDYAKGIAARAGNLWLTLRRSGWCDPGLIHSSAESLHCWGMW